MGTFAAGSFGCMAVALAAPLLVLGSLSFAAWASNNDKAVRVVVCSRATRSVVACGLAKGRAKRRVITRDLKRRVQRNWIQKKRARDDTETVFAESSLTQTRCHGTEEYVFHEVLRETLYGEIRCASGSMSGVLVAVKIYAKEAIDRLSRELYEIPGNELHMAAVMEHPNLCCCQTRSRTNHTCVCVVLPYIHAGDVMSSNCWNSIRTVWVQRRLRTLSPKSSERSCTCTSSMWLFKT